MVEAGPPSGYEQLPPGVRCKCVRSWTDGHDNYWCCINAPRAPASAPPAPLSYAALLRERDELREALRPFAEASMEIPDAWPDDLDIANIAGKRPLSVGDLRAAKAKRSLHTFYYQTLANPERQ